MAGQLTIRAGNLSPGHDLRQGFIQLQLFEKRLGYMARINTTP